MPQKSRRKRTASYFSNQSRSRFRPGASTKEFMMIHNTTRTGALLAVAVLALAQSPQPPAPSPQQPPAQQAGRGGRGFGGFTQPDPIDFEDHTGWKSIFDGKTLEG